MTHITEQITPGMIDDTCKLFSILLLSDEKKFLRTVSIDLVEETPSRRTSLLSPTESRPPSIDLS